MSDKYGWDSWHDRRGMPCAYCGKPSTRTLVVGPPAGGRKILDVRVGVCDEHRNVQQRPPKPAPVESEQTAFDIDV